MLSGGVALLLVAATALSVSDIPLWVNGALGLVGGVLLASFVLVSRNNPRAMIPPHLIIESRFLRSSLAAFAQMFTLGTVLVVMPLYLTGQLELSSSQAGVLFFVLPLTMAVMASLVSRLSDRASPRLVLRSGLSVIVVGTLIIGVVVRDADIPYLLWFLSALLIVLGVGMAMVQTPAAAGATRSPAGSRGAALGLFNMLRFSGSAAGTAWVALTYPLGDMLVVMLGCSVIALLGLAMSFFGPDPMAPPTLAEGPPA